MSLVPGGVRSRSFLMSLAALVCCAGHLCRFAANNGVVSTGLLGRVQRCDADGNVLVDCGNGRVETARWDSRREEVCWDGNARRWAIVKYGARPDLVLRLVFHFLKLLPNNAMTCEYASCVSIWNSAHHAMMRLSVSGAG